MVEYSCKRCGYTTERKGDMKKHLMKKTPCPADLSDTSCADLLIELDDRVKPYHCPYCEKGFAAHQSLYVHRKKCPLRVEDDDRDIKIQQLERQIEELKKIVDSEVRHPNVTHINHGTVNNTVNNIQINAFGKEDISYLTDHPRFKEFMVKCIRGKMEGICEFLVKKHFHPEHPENHTIKKLNKKDEFMECYDGSKWKVRFCEDVLEDIFLMMQKDFANFVESEEGLLKKVWIDTFMDQVGGPLNWDLSTENYETYRELSEDKKQELRSRVYKLACEHIYRHSKLFMS